MPERSGRRSVEIILSHSECDRRTEHQGLGLVQVCAGIEVARSSEKSKMCISHWIDETRRSF